MNLKLRTFTQAFYRPRENVSKITAAKYKFKVKIYIKLSLKDITYNNFFVNYNVFKFSLQYTIF